MTVLTYTDAERIRASAWKSTTATLPDEARLPAPYFGKRGSSGVRSYDFCLPVEFSSMTLLPEVRAEALSLFEALRIPWHAGVGRGPSNHLLSSQVQCVNALGQMVMDADRIIRCFGPVVDTTEVHEIEPGRYLTFEYIGTIDHLGEGRNGVRTRGSQCTSVDAAFVHTTSSGLRELVLIEWKYTESYRRRRPSPGKDATRFKRYGGLLAAENGPVDAQLLPFDDLLQEPLYQLMRQQLLAHELEKARAHGVDRVKVLHVLPRANDAYASSLQGDRARMLGLTVQEVWQRLLRHPDRFVSMDSAAFLDPSITSPDYVERYGGQQ